MNLQYSHNLTHFKGMAYYLLFDSCAMIKKKKKLQKSAYEKGIKVFIMITNMIA